MACEFRMKLKCVPMGVIYDKLSLVQKISRRWSTFTGHWQKPTTQVTVSSVSQSHTHHLSYFVCTRQLYLCHLTINMNVCPNWPIPFAPIMITIWHRYYLSFVREIYRSLMDSPQKGPVWGAFDVWRCTSCWTTNRVLGDWIRHDVHMTTLLCLTIYNFCHILSDGLGVNWNDIPHSYWLYGHFK